MAQETLVEMQLTDGERVIDALRQAGFDVTVAAWIKASDEGQWYLYIASQNVNSQGLTAAYRAIHPILRQLVDLWVDQFEIKLIESDDPIAKDLLEKVSKYPARIVTRYSGPYLGTLSVDEAFIYPFESP
jgi:hypothetical protein